MFIVFAITIIFAGLGGWAWYSTITTLKNYKKLYGYELEEYLENGDKQ